MDGESASLLQRIEELLVAGGYFRARISTLSPFDKLTGGLAWCIAASNVDVDYDHLEYSDDFILGEKIQIGESIEFALKKMDCPHPLQAHQIQGLDYPAVLPVVQWLVKRVIDTRDELGDQVRRYSHFHFRRNYELPRQPESSYDTLRSLAEDPDLGYLQRVSRQSRNFLVRIDQNARVDYTVLEYRHQSNQSEALSKELVPVTTDTFPFFPDSLRSKPEETVQVKRSRDEQINVLQNRIARNREKLLEMKNESFAVEKRALIDEKVRRKDFLLSEIRRLWADYGDSEGHNLLDEIMKTLRSLKTLDKEEAAFLDYSKSKQAELQSGLEHLRKAISAVSQDDSRQEIKKPSNTDEEKKNELLKQLASLNRAVIVLQRRLDDVPAQSELIQYERCFMELYVNIQAKLRETRKYYASYNALAEANEISTKEISLLNSINSQYEMAMSTPEGRAKFVISMQGILSGVQQKLQKMEARCQEKKATYNLLNDKHSSALATRRQYFALLKQLQEEFTRNENLHAVK